MTLRPCMEHGCPELSTSTRCARHTPKGWTRPSRTAKRRLRGSRSTALTTRIIARDSGICGICGGEGADTKDHIIPLAQGGTDDEANLRAAHRHCNMARRVA